MSDSQHTTNEYMSAYVDGELPPQQAAAVAAHLATCFACSADYETMLETVRSLRGGLERYTAPDVLRARIRTAVAATPSESAQGSLPTMITPVAGRRASWLRIGRWAAVALVAAALGSEATLVVTRNGAARDETEIASQVFASHLRSLMPDHLTDVRSSDQHNVKPWFNGRLDYSPIVPRLEEQGFPLIGGRIDYVGGRAVAVIVYGRRQHMINVFSWPSAAPAQAREIEGENGYTMIHWRSHGTERWVLSDLNARELQGFVSLLEAADISASASPDTVRRL
jgi:anti-sigma factor RsiW